MKKRVDDAELAEKKTSKRRGQVAVFCAGVAATPFAGLELGLGLLFFRSFIQLMIAVSYHVFYETSARVIFWLGEGFCVVFKLKLFTTRIIKKFCLVDYFYFFYKHILNFIFLTFFFLNFRFKNTVPVY